uniref:DAN domain-containing protein n=1 Tax=Clytia hemisphaerica TaxID=252671 RepID=A0A7M5WKC7_9CNID|eukprot:TCONS_00059761-protein
MEFTMSRILVLTLCAITVHSWPKTKRHQLFRNDFFRGIPNRSLFRGPRPALKAEEATVLVPYTQWKSTRCEMKKNMFLLKSPKCEPINVNRGLCYGQCSSVFIPGQNLHYSAACIPNLQKRAVEMQCDLGNGVKAKRIKFYEKVVSCSCKKVKVDWKQVVKDIRSQFEASTMFS